MRLPQVVSCAGLCSVLAFFALFGHAWAGSGLDPLTVTVLPPPLVIDLNHLDFGSSYVAINKTSSSASATISPAITLTNDPGTPGNARLIPIDTSTINKLRVHLTGGTPNMQVSLSLMDDTALTPYLTLSGQTTSDATFRIDSWTYAVQGGLGSLTGFNPATGTGIITLDNTGAIDIWFGATLHTVPSSQNYSVQAYAGTLRVTFAY